MIPIRCAAIASLCLFMGGCGTVTTVVSGDDVTRRNLKKNNSYCDTVPRVYSGLSYDLCVLHGPSKTVAQDIASPVMLPLTLLDTIPSAFVDTVILPYTIYRQNVDGSIQLSP